MGCSVLNTWNADLQYNPVLFPGIVAAFKAFHMHDFAYFGDLLYFYSRQASKDNLPLNFHLILVVSALWDPQ